MMLTFDADTTYLDHAGTTLYSKSLIEAFSKDMMANLLGNPHSASSSSQLSMQRVEDIRLRLLQLFNASPDHFDLVFVANATAGIKMVMEAFREQERGFWYGYHKDSHTSLVGMREAARAGQHCFKSDAEVEKWLDGGGVNLATKGGDTLGLFAYPAQSNMNGRRLPLSWSQRLRSSRYGAHTFTLLDAAALVSTSPLDLSDVSAAPDYTVFSFYKIFGFPDLGALIVRKAAAGPLRQRSYFGGGTVDMVTCGHENWYIRKTESLHDQLEDGTLPIHSIITLDSALDVHRRLYGSLELIAAHTTFLANRLYQRLSTLHHFNQSLVCEIYKDQSSSYEDVTRQGPILAFNLKNWKGAFISNTEVEKLANIKNLQLRSGSLCNPGGTASSLNLAPWEMKRNFSAGYRCGNENDIIGGKPNGMMRASFGAMSNMNDVETLVNFVEEFFVNRQPEATQMQDNAISSSELYVESLTIYPVKSCGGWQIPRNVDWDIREEGLAWDREWCLVHQGTRKALSQKKYPRMAMLKPVIDYDTGVLRICYHGFLPSGVPDEVSVPLSENPNVYKYEDDLLSLKSQVCGDNIMMKSYASKEIESFLSAAVGTPCTLARFPPSSSGPSTRHSKAHLASSTGESRAILLSNESPILTISRSSLNRLNEQIKRSDGKAAHASVFRANVILAEDPGANPGLEQPYAEDEWVSLRIGDDVALDVLGGCRRCQMVCIDQTTAEKDQEPFATLAKTRRRQGKVYFGVHTALADGATETRAKIRVGDRASPTVVARNTPES